MSIHRFYDLKFRRLCHVLTAAKTSDLNFLVKNRYRDTFNGDSVFPQNLRSDGCLRRGMYLAALG
jgi:hypothetical protein